MPEPLTEITWVEKLPGEVLNGLESVKKSGFRMQIGEPGRGVDSTLKWAENELSLATSDSDNEIRHACQAIIHAQSAVECLIDTIITRDWLARFLSRRATLGQKFELFYEHPGVNLPERYLRQIIGDPRNSIIHDYVDADSGDAEVIYNAALFFIRFLRGEYEPDYSIIFSGDVTYSFEGFKGIKTTKFGGFHSPFGFAWEGSDGIVKVGVGRPFNNTTAEVYWAPLDNFSKEEHFLLLGWREKIRGKGFSFVGKEHLIQFFSLAGLEKPV